MNVKVLSVAFLGLVGLPFSLTAQVTTLTYQGNTMTGETVEIIPTGTGTYDTTTPISGVFTAAITIDGSLAANDLSLASYSINGPLGSFNGSNVTLSDGSTSWLLGPGELSLTTLNGQITGASFNVNGDIGDLGSYSDSISPSGDSAYQGIYEPGTAITTITGLGGAPGTWSVSEAPEIDPASAIGGLTLLLGGLAVVRGRRPIRQCVN